MTKTRPLSHAPTPASPRVRPNRAPLSVVVGAALVLAACGQEAPSQITVEPLAAASTATAEQEVRQAVDEIVASYATTDVDNYFSYYADDVSIMRAGAGRWTKQAYYDFWKKAVADGGGVAAARVEDLQIQLSPSGDSATTTYLMPVTRKFPSGSPPTGESADIAWHMTEVWFKRDGMWKVSNLTYAQAAPPRAP